MKTQGTRNSKLYKLCKFLEEQGWRGVESARFALMLQRFKSCILCHKWIEFVVGSRPCSEGFSPGSPGSPVFLPPQKSLRISKFQFDQEFESHGIVSHKNIVCYPRYTKLIFIYLRAHTKSVLQ